MNGIKIEIVIRKRSIGTVPEKYDALLRKYMTFESEDRFVANPPADWGGLRDGTVTSMFKELGDALYMALAYYTVNNKDIVVDFDGRPVDRFEVTIDGRHGWKYVKRRMQIIRVLDEEKEIFEAKGYMVDFRFPEPIVKILDVYSVGAESGLHITQFINR